MVRTARPRAVLKIVAVNLAIFLVLAELVAVGLYYYRTGTLYYANRPRGKHAPPALESSVVGYRIHPYLGFIPRPGSHGEPGTPEFSQYNNLGFISPVDYPYRRRHRDEVLVGLFGGSVAAHLAEFERRANVLSTALATARGVDPDDVRVLNFAQGGFKQPQQLLLLGYLRALGQELDLAINVDGFNEVVLGAINQRAGVAADMPSIDHMRALQEVTMMSGEGGLERMLAVRRAWGGYSRFYNRAWSGTAWETVLASGFLIDWIVYRLHYRRYVSWRLAGADHERRPEDGVSWLYLNEAPSAGSVDWPPLIDLWSRSSRAMHRLARADGISYLHIVQPNQYHATRRTFTPAERAIAFSERTPYAQPVRDGYPRLRAALPALRAAGVPAYGLFEIFDDVDQPVYVDDCCHYNDAGQRVLATRIAALALELDGFASSEPGAQPAAATRP